MVVEDTKDKSKTCLDSWVLAIDFSPNPLPLTEAAITHTDNGGSSRGNCPFPPPPQRFPALSFI